MKKKMRDFLFIFSFGLFLLINLTLCSLQSHCYGLMSWFKVPLTSTCQMRKMDRAEKYHYILLWDSPETTTKYAKIDKYYEDHTLYESESCIYKNCLFTHSKYLMDLNKYDAILFNGRIANTHISTDLDPYQFSNIRSNDQLYAFVQYEPSPLYILKNRNLDDFFNISITYKLDSDIPIRYFNVKHKSNDTIIDQLNEINWQSVDEPLSQNMKKKLNRKTKLAAWFVSHCNVPSKRDDYIVQLKYALKDLGFNQTIDIYGKCGDLSCPKSNPSQCFNMISREYMFYLSFENSIAEDYVTEKVMNAIHYDAVPIVYGGADYRRFLPDGSYIDACKLKPKELAELMISLFNDRKKYEDYFIWRNLYKFQTTGFPFVEKVCDVLNERTNKPRTHSQFTTWWNRNNGQCSSFNYINPPLHEL